MTMPFEKLKELMPKLGTLRLSVYHTSGSGPSSTKIVYINVGLVAIYAWLLMVVAFCAVYEFTGKVDGTFAGVITAVLVTIVGFATSAQKQSNQARADASAKENSDAK